MNNLKDPVRRKKQHWNAGGNVQQYWNEARRCEKRYNFQFLPKIRSARASVTDLT